MMPNLSNVEPVASGTMLRMSIGTGGLAITARNPDYAATSLRMRQSAGFGTVSLRTVSPDKAIASLAGRTTSVNMALDSPTRMMKSQMMTKSTRMICNIYCITCK